MGAKKFDFIVHDVPFGVASDELLSENDLFMVCFRQTYLYKTVLRVSVYRNGEFSHNSHEVINVISSSWETALEYAKDDMKLKERNYNVGDNYINVIYSIYSIEFLGEVVLSAKSVLEPQRLESSDYPPFVNCGIKMM